MVTLKCGHCGSLNVAIERRGVECLCAGASLEMQPQELAITLFLLQLQNHNTRFVVREKAECVITAEHYRTHLCSETLHFRGVRRYDPF